MMKLRRGPPGGSRLEGRLRGFILAALLPVVKPPNGRSSPRFLSGCPIGCPAEWCWGGYRVVREWCSTAHKKTTGAKVCPDLCPTDRIRAGYQPGTQRVRTALVHQKTPIPLRESGLV